MHGTLELANYQFFILDASFHKEEFSPELISELAELLHRENGCRIFAAATFQNDLRRNLRLLDRHNPKQAAIYRRNQEALKVGGIRPEILSYSDYDIRDDRPHHDVRSLIKRLCEKFPPEKILLLTCDDALFEDLSANNCPISIHHLVAGKTFDAAALAQMKQVFELSNDDEVIGDIARKNIAIYDPDGVNLPLTRLKDAKGKEIGGNEAKLYQVEEVWNGQENVLAKIYNKRGASSSVANPVAPRSGKAVFPRAQAENIKRLSKMNEKQPDLFPWAAMPLAPVYDRLILHDDNSVKVDETRIVGHLMTRIESFTTLEYTDLCDPNTPLVNERKLADAVEACLALVDQILYMNSYGIRISDISDNNFGIHFVDQKPDWSKVYMFDVGGFSYKNYFGAGANGDVKPIRNTSRPKSKQEVHEYCAELLYMQILHILTVGCSIDTQTGKLPFQDPNDNCYRYRFCIPENIWQLVCSVYKGSEREAFSLEVLAEELYAAFVSMRRSGMTYADAVRQEIHPPVQPPEEADILPCTYEVQAHFVRNESRSFSYRKELPQIHRVGFGLARSEHCAAKLAVSPEPYPQVKSDVPEKAHIHLRPWIVVVFVLAALVALDMMRFSIDALHFTPAIWAEQRLVEIRDIFTELGAYFVRLWNWLISRF